MTRMLSQRTQTSSYGGNPHVHPWSIGRPYAGLPINFPRLAPNFSSCRGIQSLVLRGPHQLQFAWCQRLTFVEFCWVYYETRNMHFVNFTMRPFKISLSKVILWRSGRNQGIKLDQKLNQLGIDTHVQLVDLAVLQLSIKNTSSQN